MKKNRSLYILIALVITLLVAGYFLLKDTLTEWMYNLDKTKTNAYGTFLTYELLKEKNKKTGFIEIEESVVESFRKLNKNKTYNYIFLNQTPYYDSATIDTLCRFAEAGNTVFISTEYIVGALRDSVLEQLYHLTTISSFNNTFYQNPDSAIDTKMYSTFNFIHPAFKDTSGYHYYLKNRADTLGYFNYRFKPLEDSLIKYPMTDNNSISFAGYEDSYGIGLNFVILQHGKGKFVLLLTALPFTNYFMRTEKGLEYAEKVLAHLPKQTTIWDNVSHIYKYIESEQHRAHGKSSFGETPLYFILKNTSLRWAWYLTIIGIIIYAVFHAKRRQNIIPVIEPKQNNSLKYVETIGQLYFHENEHIEIANEMRLQFLNFIRQKYYVKTNEIDDAFFKTLSLKSSVEEEKIKALFEDFTRIQKVQPIDRDQLHAMNQKLEYFYSNCK